MEKGYKYFNLISVFFVSILLISNIASTKIIDVIWFTFDGGTLLFPLSYIFNDILTEVYGYKKSRQAIWLGFFSALMMSFIFIIIGALPSASGWENQDAYMKILGFTPRIVFASLIAYFCGEFLNSFILAKAKILTNGKWLWVRIVGSTIFGELIDSLIFIFIAFWGVLSVPLIFTLITCNFIFKVLFEVLFLPVTYKIIDFLKKEERIDFYDRKTNFNPFKFGN